MRTCQGLAMPLHLVRTEQFRAQWRIGGGVHLRQAAAAQACQQIEQDPGNEFEVRIQFSGFLLCSAVSTMHPAIRSARQCPAWKRATDVAWQTGWLQPRPGCAATERLQD